MTSDLGIVRDEIVSRLVGRTALQIVRGKFQTTNYPIVYHDLPSNSSRSTNTITWSGTIAARDRGVRKGHIVAEINAGGEYVRYAYISTVTNDTSITYGASATDTSDGTALDASNTIRLVIPLRPGDIIKTVNAQSDVNTDQVILNLGYDESPGMFAARYETVGSNNKFNNIFAEADEIRSSIADQADRKFPGARGDRAKGELTFFFDGFINRGSNPSDANDYRRINWTNTAGATSGTAGTLTFSDGTKYPIACANSPTLTTAEHTIFFRNTRSKATANKSDTAFQVILSTSYAKDSEDILVGWCHASDNKAGAKAVLVLAAQFSSNNLFASGQNGSLTEALLSKSAQEYTSGLEIKPVTSGSNRHLQVTWAACTATSGPTSTPDERLTFGDGDVWSIAVKDGSNYSVTGNGSSYSNITVLAANSTYFVFVDTADTASGGTLTLRFTTTYSHISTASDGTFFSSRVIMGQIAVPANGNDGAAPRIFPFNNRSLTLNAAAIAADAITATHITATAIDTTHLKLTGTNGIGGITSGGNLNLTNVEGSLDLDNTADGTRKAASSAQLTAADAAALGLNTTGDFIGTIKKNVVVDGTSNSPTFYSWSGSQTTPGNLVLVNAQGIAGYTGVTGTYTEGSGSNDGLTLPANPEFQIRTTDGQGVFGGGVGTLSSAGLIIDMTVAGDNEGRIIIKSDAGEHGISVIREDNGYPGGTLLFGTGIAHKQVSFNMSSAGSNDPRFLFGTNMYLTTIGKDGGSGTTSYSGVRGIYFTSRTGNGNLPEAPVANGTGVLYSKADGILYWRARTNAGSLEDEVELGGGGTDDGVFYIQSDSGSGAKYSVSTHSNTNVTTQFLGGTGINVTNSGAVFTITSTVTDTNTHRAISDTSSSSSTVSISRKGLQDHEATTHGGAAADPLRLGNGTAGAPSFSFTNDTSAGMYHTGSALAFSDASTFVMAIFSEVELYKNLDMNGWILYDFDEAQARSDGDANDPTYTWINDLDTGMYLHHTGAVAISGGSATKLLINNSTNSTTYVYNNLNVVGSLTKQSGTFSIAHPLDEDNKTLVHGFVESPRYDLIYRGSAILSGGTATVSIDEASNNMTVGTFEALTKNPQVWVQNDTGWGAVKGTVENGNIIITAEDNTSSDTVSWLVVAERNDTFIRSEKEPWTDETGAFVPEWDTASLNHPVV
jgi:hypothetical protein